MSPKITLFLGGARSGKSRLAQRTAEMCPGPLTYVATGEAGDDEMAARIAQHQADRSERWRTLECPLELPAAINAVTDGALLVDCLTLWLSNLMLTGQPVETRTTELVSALEERALPVFLVSNEVGMGIVPDHPLGRAFRDEAGRLNQAVAAAADAVWFVIAGRGLPLQTMQF